MKKFLILSLVLLAIGCGNDYTRVNYVEFNYNSNGIKTVISKYFSNEVEAVAFVQTLPTNNLTAGYASSYQCTREYFSNALKNK